MKVSLEFDLDEDYDDEDGGVKPTKSKRGMPRSRAYGTKYRRRQALGAGVKIPDSYSSK